MVTCAIIDTGLDCLHKSVVNQDLFGFTLSDDEPCTLIESFQDTYGHGTAIYNIIYNGSEQIHIINVKIASIEQSISEKSLISVLNYIEKNYNVDVINLSLGTKICENGNELYNICKCLDNKGVILVAAFDNEGSMSFPAAFDCVIGVTTDDKCVKKNDFVYFEDDLINIGAKGGIQRLAWTTPEYVFMEGNSFACAHVTRQVLQFLLDGAHGRTEVLKAFSSIAVSNYTCQLLKNKQKPIPNISGRVAIFPFNKEMHSVVRYLHLLSFSLTKIYDTKYTGHIGSDTQRVMNDKSVNKILIENIELIDFDAFDTFVFGHFDELAKWLKENFREALLHKLIEHQKQIISFDDLDKQSLLTSHPSIYCPSVNKEDVPLNRLGKLYQISKPIIGVFGTSSRQGKFTLQLKLRELFLKNGYDIGQISTEPQGILFNMDCLFPIGYNSSVYIDPWETVLYLNEQIYQLCLKHKDIIIVGSQACTIPYDIGNLEMYTFRQHAFLMATCPDAVILVINPYDDIDYVLRTINYLESLEYTKVISLVVFPMDIDENWLRINQRKKAIKTEKFYEIQKMYQNLNIPIYLLGNETHMNELFTMIETYFSETK